MEYNISVCEILFSQLEPDKCVHSGAGNDKNKTNFNVRTEKNCPTYVPFISNKTSIVILFHLYFYSQDCLTFHIRI